MNKVTKSRKFPEPEDFLKSLKTELVLPHNQEESTVIGEIPLKSEDTRHVTVTVKQEFDVEEELAEAVKPKDLCDEKLLELKQCKHNGIEDGFSDTVIQGSSFAGFESFVGKIDEACDLLVNFDSNYERSLKVRQEIQNVIKHYKDFVHESKKTQRKQRKINEFFKKI